MSILVLVLLAFMQCAAASTPAINGSSGGFSLRVVAKQPLLDGDGDLASLQRAVKQVQCRIRHRLLPAGVAAEYDTDEIRSSMCPLADHVYAAMVGIGHDAQPYELALDMSSTLTWMQCVPCHPCQPQLVPVFNPARSPTFHQVPQNSELCRSPFTGEHGRCHFSVMYRNGGSAEGYLGKDTFSFQSDHSSAQRLPDVVFGCATETTNFRSYSVVAGVLGLGMAKVRQPDAAFISHVHHDRLRFSYCPITPGSTSHNFLRFGVDVPPPLPNVPRQLVQLMSANVLNGGYYVDLEGVSVDGVRLRAVTRRMFVYDSRMGGGCVVDIGTKLSSFVAPAYGHIAAAIRDHLRRHGARFVDPPGIEQHLPSMTLHFVGGASLRVAPKQMFMPVVASHGHPPLCLGLVSNPAMTVIGAMQQINTRFIFDLQGASPVMRFNPEDCHLDA